MCEFREEDGATSIEIVPSTWFDNDANLCFWPHTNGSSQAKKQRLAMPSWPKYPAKMLYSTSRYLGIPIEIE